MHYFFCDSGAPRPADDAVFGRPDHSHHHLKPSGGSPKSISNEGERKVLIVEDERIVAENLRFVLEDKKWKVIGIAASGEEAVRGAQESNPDLILMDIRIQGDLDGIQAAMLIQESLPKKPMILFISAHPSEAFPHLNALAPGSFAYLKKPYTPEDLAAEIKNLIRDTH